MQISLAALLVVGLLAPVTTGPPGPTDGAPVAGTAAALLQEELPEPVDVNSASAEDLQEVPGIGPAIARRIVEFRQEHGRLERLEDLLHVRGIGSKTLEKLRPYLTVGEPEAEEGRPGARAAG